MATTRLMSLHVGKGRDVSTAIADIIDYVKNPQKTDFGKFIYGYECDTRIADAEFLLSKRQYANRTGRDRGADDVIAYHLRQAFKPGEVTPEEANQIGRELALKLTKGNHAFVVCTHVDKYHVHNHIIINSTTLDCQKKFRNFWGSTWAIRRMNDKLCLEHGLSIVENPKPSRDHYGTWLGSGRQPSHQEQLRWVIDEALKEKPKDFEEFLKKMEAAGVEVNRERKHLCFRLSPEDRYTRCDTLKGDYTEQAIRERIAGTRTATPRRTSHQKPVSKVGLLVDIEAAIRSGKGPGYERWAKVFNLKQLSQAVIYLKEHGDMSYEDLKEKSDAATDSFNALPPILEYLDVRNFLGRFAIWMLLGLCIAVYSPSPIRAAVNVFAFSSGMVASYYAYSKWIAGFFPQSYALIWAGFTVISPLLAFICWYAKGKSKVSFAISAMILAVLFNMTFVYGRWYFEARSSLELITFICGLVVLRRSSIKESIMMLAAGVGAALILNLLVPFHFG